MGGLSGILFRQRPADLVTLIFLLFLNALTVIFYSAVPKAPFLIGLYSVLIIVQVVLVRFQNHGTFLGVLHAIVFPIVCVLLVFDSLGQLVHSINPTDIDPLLIRIDYMIFHDHPTVMLEKIMWPLLTDILQLSYASYYFIPISFCVLLFKAGRKNEFDRSVFLILFCFYLSYLGYLLFPALGPRFYLNSFQTTELHGFLISGPIQNLLNGLEGIKRDAFPSGHTAITVLVLCLAYRYNKVFFRIALPIVSALVFATVYCRYHYVIDVIAGIALTFLTLVLGDRYYAWWEQIQNGLSVNKERKPL
jgi:membrane-associated phospholipid phosphatase